jgi:ribosomal protein S18 acetylase RimI-like enzyme
MCLDNAMQLTVSPMQPEEADAVALIVRSIIPTLHYYNERAKQEEVAKYSEGELRGMSREDPASILVARIGGRVVGFCLSRYDDGLIWLSWFGVVPGNRKQGLGRALLDALAATLHERKAHKIWCDTRTDNVRSQQVLEAAGFKRITQIANHWYGQDFILWEWYPA